MRLACSTCERSALTTMFSLPCLLVLKPSKFFQEVQFCAWQRGEALYAVVLRTWNSQCIVTPTVRLHLKQRRQRGHISASQVACRLQRRAESSMCCLPLQHFFTMTTGNNPLWWVPLAGSSMEVHKRVSSHSRGCLEASPGHVALQTTPPILCTFAVGTAQHPMGVFAVTARA